MINYFRTDGWVKTSQGPAVPGAQIFVCLQPANVGSLPPTPLAVIFSDVNGLVPITQPIITDGFGHYDFYTQAGLYTVIVGLGGLVQQVYPDQSIGAFSNGGGTALILQVNGAPAANQLLLNLAGQNSVSVVDAGGGTINIVGSVFKTNGIANTVQGTLNLQNGTGITMTSDALGNVTIASLGGSLPSGSNVIPLPPIAVSVFPGTSQSPPATSNTTSIVQYIPGNSLLCQPTNWKITVNVAIPTTFNFTMVRCTQYTGIVLASIPITFGGVTNPALGAGLNTSDAMAFSITSGFDYFLIAHSTGSGTNLWLVNNTETVGGSYVEPSDFTSTSPITFTGGTTAYGFFITHVFQVA